MFLIDLLKQGHSLEILQGVEKKLLKGRRQQKISGFLLVATLLIQLVVLATTDRFDILSNFPSYVSSFFKFIRDLFTNWEALPTYTIPPEVLLFYGLFIFLLILFFFIVKNQFIRLSEDPFQYTFWVNPFLLTQLDDNEKDVSPLSVNEKNKLFTFRELLHHDLIEKMSERIGRLSLLQVDKASQYSHLSAHIHIEGYISLRQETKDRWIIHIRPRVCIGSFDGPFTLTTPVKEPIVLNKLGESITVEKYNQAMERVYSSVTTEIYKQIKKDLEEKIKLFPTRFLKAVALYNEAKDFAQSNTIDAYDLSLNLYLQAIQYLNTSFRSVTSKCLFMNQFLYRYAFKTALPRWLIDIRYHYVKSKIQNGYAQCKIYKSYISSITGRESDPLYELPDSLTNTLHALFLIHNSLVRRKQGVNPTYFKKQRRNRQDDQIDQYLNVRKTTFYQVYASIPTDSWLRKRMFRPSASLMNTQKSILFDTLVVLSLVYINLKATYRSEKFYSLAKSVAPQLSKSDPVFLLTAAELQRNIANKLSYLAQSIKNYDRFEVTQFLFARWRELKFRMDNEIYRERCHSVIEDYENTLRINPGNIAALASQGYLYWLTGNLEEAERKFERGKDIKAIIKKTFTAPINYGLARIAVEKGQFNKCYDLYQEAIGAEPIVAAYGDYYLSNQSQGIYYYDLIGSQMVERYQRFLNTLNDNIEQLKYYYHPKDVCNLPLICQFLKGHLEKGEKHAEDIRNFKYENHSLKELLYAEPPNHPEDNLLGKMMVSFLNSYFKKTDGHAKAINYQNTRRSLDKTVPGIRAFITENSLDFEGEYLSARVLNGVKSFVYNDFGNACTNYYYRFGLPAYSERAIDAYQVAIQADPSNKVAHYNLAISLLNIRKPIDSYKHLKQARKLDKEWTVPIHDLSRRFSTEQIRDAEQKIQELVVKKEVSTAKTTGQSPIPAKKDKPDER